MLSLSDKSGQPLAGQIVAGIKRQAGRYWHEADMTMASSDVRFRRQSGHGPGMA
jgi:hypothetical protein